LIFLEAIFLPPVPIGGVEFSISSKRHADMDYVLMPLGVLKKLSGES
jgi:hypothetical protein